MIQTYRYCPARGRLKAELQTASLPVRDFGASRLPPPIRHSSFVIRHSSFRTPHSALSLFTLLTLLVLAVGCASTVSRVPLSGNPLVDGPVMVSQGPAKDRVLWQYRMAAADMRKGQFAEAKRNLDDALLRVGAIIGPDRSARKSRNYFQEESKKTFLGEPYERAMAYYYRGILYWLEGEPDNARACFRNAQFQDSDAEEKTFSSDYVLLEYLDGLATTKLHGDGRDALKRARALARGVPLPDYDPQANVLLFFEFGRGPAKYASGEYHEQLRILPGNAEARAVQVTVQNQRLQAPAYDDLTYQATTRGGRQMDYILANKAVFKSATDSVGNVALIGGLIMASNRQTQEAGLGLAAFGLVSKLISSATTPAADVRAWDNLPQYLCFMPLRLPPGEHTASVEFLAGGIRPMAGQTKTINIKVTDPTKDLVIFVSDQSSTPQTYAN